MKPSILTERRIGFIGGGAMAEALLRGLVKMVPPEHLMASDISQARLDLLRSELGIRVSIDNVQVCAESDTIVLAVKPQILPLVLASLKDVITSRHLVISIAAGITLNRLESLLPTGTPVVRVMPNTPALIGQGASAFAGGQSVTGEHTQVAKELLEAVGMAEVVGEAYLDAVTGLSGSGPAYVYLFIEAMIDAGVKEGLPRDLARKLALQTVIGSAQMVLQSGNHPAVERDKVTSPGGTTIAAVQALEYGGLRSAVFAAVKAATNRSRELAGS